MVYPLRFANPKPHIIFTAPAEAVMLSMKIALVGGLIVSIPYVFYQIWAFVSPGLYGKEKKVVLPVVISSSFSFFLGLTFAYLAIPLLLKVLTRFGGGIIEPYFKASEYISFLIKMGLACGIIFEMPMVSWFLTRMGLLTPKFLVSKLRHAIVIIFIVAAVISPPDVLSSFPRRAAACYLRREHPRIVPDVGAPQMNMGLDFSEILVIMVLILIFFGSKEIPNIMRQAGRFVGKVRLYSEKVRREINEISKLDQPMPTHDQEVQKKKEAIRETYIAKRKELAANSARQNRPPSGKT